MIKHFFSLALILICSQAFASKSIETPYLDLMVPDAYQCTSETGRYVCQEKSTQKNDSILTMVFKRSGPQDTIAQYLEFIKRPMSRVTPSGPPALSKVEFVRTIKIDGYDWVEAKHFESEVPNYFTYYWATARAPVAMIVTFSVEKNREKARLSELTAIRDSLRTKFVQYSPPENQQTMPGVTPGGAAANDGSVNPQAEGISTNEHLVFGQKPIVIIVGAILIIGLLFLIARR